MSRAQNEHARAPRGPRPVTDRSRVAPDTTVTPSGHRSAFDRVRAGHMGASHGALRGLTVAVPSTCPAGALSVPAQVTDKTSEGPL